ncbi:MAG: outer membrane beta-barrel protein [Alphaproteobacteria bacterium]|nr:outer membrane beta-barrel protein [Alphaproteobacteria bacterium]
MLRHSNWTVTLAAALTMSSLAVADEQGPYVGFGIGLHQPNDRSYFDGTTTRSDVEFGDGGVGIGYFGYDFGDMMRAEIELGYRRAIVDEFSGPGGIGSQKQLTALGNLLMDLDIDAAFTPYIGIGAGLGKTKWDAVGGVGTPLYDGSNTKFTWQAIAGFLAPLTDRVDLTIDYRYVQSGKMRFDTLPTGGTAADRYNPQSHNIMVGLKFNLWEPTPAPTPVAQPVPSPRPPAQPPAPASKLPEQFIVFFDWDKSSLTTTAQNIVKDAQEYADREGAVQITATGHADRSGSSAYNISLSERRARAVRAELIRLGIPENEIVFVWNGEDANLVPTADGVREPQNRRVEIVIE